MSRRRGKRHGKDSQRPKQANPAAATHSSSETNSAAAASTVAGAVQEYPKQGRRHRSAEKVTQLPADESAQTPITEPIAGKPLSDIDEARKDASSKAGEIGRQLAFAGIATIWILSGETSDDLGGALLIGLTFLSLSLLADFLQYVYCARVWRKLYNDEYNKRRSDGALIDIPDALSERTYYFYRVKIVLLLVGYTFLLAGAMIQMKAL